MLVSTRSTIRLLTTAAAAGVAAGVVAAAAIVSAAAAVATAAAVAAAESTAVAAVIVAAFPLLITRSKEASKFYRDHILDGTIIFERISLCIASRSSLLLGSLLRLDIRGCVRSSARWSVGRSVDRGQN